MKRIIFFFLLLLADNAFSQYIALNTLINYINKDVSDINEDVLSKNWVFLRSEEDDDSWKSIQWANDYGKFDSVAKAWLTIYSKGLNKRVVYQFHSNKHYATLMSSLKAFKPIKWKNNIGEDKIVTIYLGAHYVYVVSVKTNIYTFSIYQKNDYFKPTNENELATDSLVATIDTIEMVSIYETRINGEISSAILRNQPTNDSSFRYYIRKEDIIEVIERGEIFYLVRVGNNYGYVYKQLLRDQ